MQDLPSPDDHDNPDVPYVPLPDRHQQALIAFEDRLQRLGAFLRPQWREICRLHALGTANAEIAEKTGVTPATVAKTLDRERCQQYVAALTAHIQYLHGPTIAARQQMLWRIAKANEDDEPRVSIQAVDVLNKQDGTYAAHAKPEIGELNIQIINNFTQEPTRERPVNEIEGHATAIEVEIDDDHDT